MTTRAAFHFNADHESLGDHYGRPINNRFFFTVLGLNADDVELDVYLGDLLFWSLAETRKLLCDDSIDVRYDREKLREILGQWIAPGGLWSSKIEEAIDKNIYTFYLPSVELSVAESINADLNSYPPYLGGTQPDSESVIFPLYSKHLVKKFRVEGRALKVQSDPADPDEGLAAEMRELPFTTVELATF